MGAQEWHKLLIVPGSDPGSLLGELHPGVVASLLSTLNLTPVYSNLVTLQGALQEKDHFNLRPVKMCSLLVDQNGTGVMPIPAVWWRPGAGLQQLMVKISGILKTCY